MSAPSKVFDVGVPSKDLLTNSQALSAYKKLISVQNMFSSHQLNALNE